MDKQHAVIAIVAAALVAFVIGYVMGTSNVKEPPQQNVAKLAVENTKQGGPAAPATGNGAASDQIPVGNSPFKGPADAAITIVEFSEFQCPFCARVLPTVEKLRKEYPNDVRIVFKHNPLPFHKDAPLAAEAALAAHEQGKFWEYHDVLFKNLKALKRPQLEKYAQDLQLDMAKFKAALDSGKFKAQVKEDQALAAKLGARGTPHFFVNGVRVKGAKPYDAFKDIVDKELPKAKSAGGASAYASRVKANYKAAAASPKKNKPGRPPANDKTIYKVPVGKSPVKGNSKEALVTIVEFSEFQCPFCSRVGPTLKKIQDEYGDKVRIVFKHLPLSFHKDAKPAAIASMAAQEQGKFWEYHDILFKNQRKLKPENLREYAQQLQLNMKQFDAALAKKEFEARVNEDSGLARDLGARGTPHFFINGKRLSGAQPFDAFKSAVEDALKRAKPQIDKGLKGDALYSALIANGATKFKAPAGGGGAKAPDTTVYDVPVGDSPTFGPANAPVTIVEFSEFQCPFCSRVLPTIDALKKKYGNKIRFAFKHQPLSFHKDAPLAAEASMAAHEQGKFWEYHDILFKNQRALKRPQLEEYAQQLGLNMTKFKAALDSGKYKEHIKKDQALAAKVGARGTPTLFINGRKLVGAQPISAFEPLIEAALKKGKK